MLSKSLVNLYAQAPGFVNHLFSDILSEAQLAVLLTPAGGSHSRWLTGIDRCVFDHQLEQSDFEPFGYVNFRSYIDVLDESSLSEDERTYRKERVLEEQTTYLARERPMIFGQCLSDLSITSLNEEAFERYFASCSEYSCDIELSGFDGGEYKPGECISEFKRCLRVLSEHGLKEMAGALEINERIREIKVFPGIVDSLKSLCLKLYVNSTLKKPRAIVWNDGLKSGLSVCFKGVVRTIKLLDLQLSSAAQIVIKDELLKQQRVLLSKFPVYRGNEAHLAEDHSLWLLGLPFEYQSDPLRVSVSKAYAISLSGEAMYLACCEFERRYISIFSLVQSSIPSLLEPDSEVEFVISKLYSAVGQLSDLLYIYNLSMTSDDVKNWLNPELVAWVGKDVSDKETLSLDRNNLVVQITGQLLRGFHWTFTPSDKKYALGHVRGFLTEERPSDEAVLTVEKLIQTADGLRVLREAIASLDQSTIRPERLVERFYLARLSVYEAFAKDPMMSAWMMGIKLWRHDGVYHIEFDASIPRPLYTVLESLSEAEKESYQKQTDQCLCGDGSVAFGLGVVLRDSRFGGDTSLVDSLCKFMSSTGVYGAERIDCMFHLLSLAIQTNFFDARKRGLLATFLRASLQTNLELKNVKIHIRLLDMLVVAGSKQGIDRAMLTLSDWSVSDRRSLLRVMHHTFSASLVERADYRGWISNFRDQVDLEVLMGALDSWPEHQHALNGALIDRLLQGSRLYELLKVRVTAQSFMGFLNDNTSLRDQCFESEQFIIGLCALYSDATGLVANTSGLYWALAHPGSRQLFISWLKVCEKLRENLFGYPGFIAAMCALHSEVAGLDVNPSVLYWIISITESRQLFMSWLKENSDLRKSLFANPDFIKALCAPCSESASSHANLSPLYVILASSNSAQLFISWLNEDEELRRNLFGHPDFIRVLYVLIPDRAYAGMYANTSVLSWFLYYCNLRQLFMSWLKDDEGLRKSLFANPGFIRALCVLTDKSVGNYENISVVYMILGSLTSCDLFMSWLNEDGRLRKNLFTNPDFIKALCALRSKSAGKYENISPLYAIFLCPETRQLFMSWLKEDEGLRKSLFANPDFMRALCALRSEAAGEHTNISPLYMICVYAESRQLFMSWLKEGEDLRKSLFANPGFIRALCALRSEAVGFDANISPLYEIFLYPESCQLFMSWLKEDEGLRKSLFANPDFMSALCALRSESAGKHENISPLYAIFLYPESCQLFMSWLKEDEGLRKSLFANPGFIRALCALRSEAAGLNANISPLYMICVYAESRQLFMSWLKEDEDLRKSLFANPDFIKALCAPRPVSAGMSVKTSGLYFILSYVPSREQLKRFLKNDVGVCKQIEAEINHSEDGSLADLFCAFFEDLDQSLQGVSERGFFSCPSSFGRKALMMFEARRSGLN